MNNDTITQPVRVTPEVFVYNTSTPPTIAKKPQELLHLYNDKNPMLLQRQPAFDMEHPPVNVIEFANQMLYTMNHYGGVGLAAPQCGMPFRMFVMTGGIVCINPEIDGTSTNTVHLKEGCLSFPGLYMGVTRPESIHIKYTNEFGTRVEANWNGVTARIALHEYDHLEGRVFTSKVGSLTLQMAKKKRDKLLKKIALAVDLKTQHLKATGKDKTYGRIDTARVSQHQIPTAAIRSNRES